MNRLLILFLFIPTICIGQDKFEGEYYNHFGDTLRIFESMYFLNINIDGYFNTYVGRKISSNDTIYLNEVLDMNSLRRNHSSYSSRQEKAAILDRKIREEKKIIEEYSWRFRNQSTFFKKNDTLFLINSAGKIDNRKFLKSGKEFGTYFMNTKEKGFSDKF